DLSIGCAGDLERATDIARAVVEEIGMGSDEVGIGRFPTLVRDESERRQYSVEQLAAIDRRVRQILEEAGQRAAAILQEHQSLVETLRDLLLEKKVLDAKTLQTIVSLKDGD